MLKLELHRYAKTRMPELKVMLLGQGADEFAGGYSQSMGNENQSWPAYTRRLAGIHAQMRRTDAGIPVYMHPALAPGYPPDRETGNLAEYHRHMLMRVSMLQRYNLWHEDRTSACQGVEARVPFLDHRLVELLASVPSALHESLFFDKRIVRAQLAGALPSYPPNKLKVKFYSTGKGQSINGMRIGMIRRTFAEFRSKYLDQPGAIFSAESLDACYQQIVGGTGVAEEDLTAFFDCMAITVFDHLCKSIPTAGAPPGVDPPSPLQTWNG
jgi:asparagine synthase (glutamine-hydrolysing)